MRLEGKVVVVTGASAGMGRSIVERFAQEGAKVVAVARRQEVLEELKDELADAPGQVEVYAGDVSKKEICEGMIDFAVEKFGRLDVLINNAGIMDDMAAVGDMDEELLERVFRLNLFGSLYAMKKAVQVFLAQGREDEDEECGNIINITSIGATHHTAGVAYCASKAALDSATKNTAYMYMKEGIRCNALAPGGIITDMPFNMPKSNDFGNDRVQQLVKLAPAMGEGEDIANTVLFLASRESRYINGQSISVNGGWMNA